MLRSFLLVIVWPRNSNMKATNIPYCGRGYKGHREYISAILNSGYSFVEEKGLMLLDFIFLVLYRARNTYVIPWIFVEWKNDPKISMYIFVWMTLLPASMPLFMRIWPTWKYVSVCGVLWRENNSAIYAKGRSLPEGPYIFNIPIALFPKTNIGDPLGQETQIQRTMNALQNGSVLFFNHSTSIDHLSNMVLGTKQSSRDQDN